MSHHQPRVEVLVPHLQRRRHELRRIFRRCVPGRIAYVCTHHCSRHHGTVAECHCWRRSLGSGEAPRVLTSRLWPLHFLQNRANGRGAASDTTGAQHPSSGANMFLQWSMESLDEQMTLARVACAVYAYMASAASIYDIPILIRNSWSINTARPPLNRAPKSLLPNCLPVFQMNLEKIIMWICLISQIPFNVSYYR